MIETRNRILHAYDEKVLNIEFEAIVQKYFPKLMSLAQRMENKAMLS
ncbi:hypothetical protein [Lonepinella koalarum]